MISQVSEFKLLDRGFKDAIVLIPGWATDYRIFTGLELNYNYILPLKLNPFDFNIKLSGFLKKESINKVSLFGWSLGGFLALEFALKNDEKIEGIVLIGVRKEYNRAALEEIKEKITKNRKGYLIKFYHECFSANDKHASNWFKKNLLKDYLETIKTEDLISGLNYLSSAYISLKALASIKKIRVFHGFEDKIAPFKEAQEFKDYLPESGFIGILSGHALFLNKDFKKIYENG